MKNEGGRELLYGSFLFKVSLHCGNVTLKTRLLILIFCISI